MSKHVYFRRRVDSRLRGDEVKIEKVGEDTYRITTGEPEEHDFRNEIKSGRFRENFAREFDSASEEEDSYRLEGKDSHNNLEDFQKKLERGEEEISFKVR